MFSIDTNMIVDRYYMHGDSQAMTFLWEIWCKRGVIISNVLNVTFLESVTTFYP